VRLRFINGSSMTFFDVRIPGLSMTVVQSDGNDVEPVAVDEFRIGNAETYDVIVEPDSNSAYTIFAQAADRSGYARGTLAPAMGMTAAVPHLDPRPLRTMVDMGMAMSAMKMPNMKMPSTSSTGAARQDMSSMDMGSRPTAMGETQAPKTSGKPMELSFMDMARRNMPFPQPGPNTKAIGDASAPVGKLVSMLPKQMHIGPQIDGLSMAVRERLNDPGDGLQGSGRRVLTYSDLRARYRGVDRRPPTREIELHLTGNMERYIWGFDGKKFTDAGPIEVTLGERVRFVFINDSMMDHPIHLHGLWSEIETGNGEFNPYKHTVIVKPSERVSYLVSADTAGRWALHCHLLFHMRAGMFRTVVVA
jgi:CopA family copper-resistance protein